MRPVLTLAALVLAVCALASCASHAPSALPMKIRLAVLDFSPPDDSYYKKDFSYARKTEGWMAGAASIYRDAHVGIELADHLASRLNRTESVTVTPRHDLRYYMADKADRLRKQFPKLMEDQIAKLAHDAVSSNAVQVGKELQVDRVITGQVLSASMAMNDFSKVWVSRVTARVVMRDVETGAVIFDKTFKKNMLFASSPLTMEEWAEDFAQWFAKEYGYK